MYISICEEQDGRPVAHPIEFVTQHPMRLFGGWRRGGSVCVVPQNEQRVLSFLLVGYPFHSTNTHHHPPKKKSTMLCQVSFVVGLVVLSSSSSCLAAKQSEKCNVDCQPNGVCGAHGVCVCDSGFAGVDCSFPYQTCPDGMQTCFDGAECTRLTSRFDDDSVSQYQCDCSTMPDASPFQISECNSPESEACFTETSSTTVASGYSFCTNGGTCIQKVATGEPHAGCRCPADFEGRHCQYRKGTAPDAELKMAFAEEEHHIEGFLLFFIILIVGCVLGGLGCIIYGKRYAQPVTTMKDIEDSTRDLQLEVTDLDETPKGELA